MTRRSSGYVGDARLKDQGVVTSAGHRVLLGAETYSIVDLVVSPLCLQMSSSSCTRNRRVCKSACVFPLHIAPCETSSTHCAHEAPESGQRSQHVVCVCAHLLVVLVTVQSPLCWSCVPFPDPDRTISQYLASHTFYRGLPPHVQRKLPQVRVCSLLCPDGPCAVAVHVERSIACVLCVQ